MTLTSFKDTICLEFHGSEQIWALRAKISIPSSTINDIRFETVFKDWCKWEVRMPGTGAPKLLIAGSYWTEEGWDFLYVRKPGGFYKPPLNNVLVIETNQNRYKRLIVSSDKSESERIIKWWKSQKSKGKKSSTSR
jgi:hypothetical protein